MFRFALLLACLTVLGSAIYYVSMETARYSTIVDDLRNLQEDYGGLHNAGTLPDIISVLAVVERRAVAGHRQVGLVGMLLMALCFPIMIVGLCDKQLPKAARWALVVAGIAACAAMPLRIP